MIKNMTALIIILPLCAALLCMLLTKIHRTLGRWTAIVAVAASLVLSIIQLKTVIEGGPIHYYFGNYLPPIGIEFVVDTVNALVIILIDVIGLSALIFMTEFEEDKDRTVLGGYYALALLLIVGLLGMTTTGDVFNLYVFLELSSLSGYCLISMGGDKGVVAAFRYMLMGTVAATFYLMGVAVLYAATGTLNMADMSQILDSGLYDDSMLVAMICFVICFGIKLAHFPFHGWQPSVHTYADAGSKPIIAGVMFKVPGYAMFRYLYCVFGTDFKYFNFFITVIGVLAVSGMLYGSIRAMGQKDIRKLFAYSSVTQMSYITLGIAIGTPIALAGSFLHIIGHAFMKGGLFLASGVLKHKYGITDLKDFGRVYKDMPLTAGLITIAALSMVGIPPTTGFFSKWYLACGAASLHEWIYVAVLVISSLLNAIYFFKLIEKIFIQQKSERHEHGGIKNGEKSFAVAFPLILYAAAIVLIGIFNVKIVDILLITLEGVGL